MPKELSYLEAIREALAEEMRRDPKVFVLGEDVGEYGGAFGVTQGLFAEFGELRVVEMPISESASCGNAVRRLHLVRLRSDRESGRHDAIPVRRASERAYRNSGAERRECR